MKAGILRKFQRLICLSVTSCFLISAVTASGQTADYSVDVLDRIKANFPDAGFATSFARVSKGSGELHVSFEPKTFHPDIKVKSVIDAMKSPSDDMTAEEHAIAHSLIALINATPSGAYIRVSTYNFTYGPIVDAMKAAVRRGVIFRALLSNNQGIMQDILREPATANTTGQVNPEATNPTSTAYQRYKSMERSIEALRGRLGISYEDDDVNFMTHILTCNHGTSGGCVGAGKNHNKFLIFGKVCNFGLDTAGLCKTSGTVTTSIPVAYQDVSAQMTMNISSDQIAIYNTLTVLVNSDIYDAYQKYYQELYEHKIADWNAANRQPVASETIDTAFLFYRSINVFVASGLPADHSVFEFYGTPRNTDLNDDALFTRLNQVVCHTVSSPSGDNVTNIRVSNAHWTLARARSFIETINQIRARSAPGAKCLVQVLGNELFGQTQDPALVDSNDNETTDANEIVNELTQAGIEVRGSENHTKYLIVDQPPAPIGTSTSAANWADFLMYGSLSITSASQKNNDETWIVWKNPRPLALQHYNESFKARWAISFVPTNIYCPLISTNTTNPTKWIPHGYQVTAFDSAGKPQLRVCSNGVFSGSAAYANYRSANPATPTLTPPSPPHSVIAVSGIGNATVSFTKPIYNGKCLDYTADDAKDNCVGNIRKYYIDVYKVGSSTIFKTVSTIYVSNNVLSGLLATDRYFFKVRAENNDLLVSLASAASGSVSVTAAEPAVMAKPTVATGQRSAIVSFIAPASPGAPITNFRVYTYSVSSSGAIDQLKGENVNASLRSFVVENLDPLGKYLFKVRAKNLEGVGGSIDEAVASNPVTIPPEPPSAPTFPASKALIFGDGFIRVNFVGSEDTGGVDVRYDLKLLNASGVQIGATVSNVTSPYRFDSPSVQNGTGYSFKIVASNGGGSSAVTSSVVKPGASQPTAIVAFVSKTGTTSKVKVTVVAPPTNGGAPIQEYEVYHEKPNGKRDILGRVPFDTSADSHAPIYLEPGSYSIRVRAINTRTYGSELSPIVNYRAN